jgi:hypothetical protein
VVVEVGDVRAGREGLVSLAGEYDDSDVGSPGQRLGDPPERQPAIVVDGVPALRAGEGDRRNRVLDANDDVAIRWQALVPGIHLRRTRSRRQRG